MSGTKTVFADNLAAAEKIAARLAYSQGKLAGMFPLQAADVERLDQEGQEHVDAFLKRFEQMVDVLANRLFRGVGMLEQEDISGYSKRDLTLLMQKFGILDDIDRWSGMAILRNKLAHEYPNEPSRLADRINEAYRETDLLLQVFGNIKAHVMRKGLLT